MRGSSNTICLECKHITDVAPQDDEKNRDGAWLPVALAHRRRRARRSLQGVNEDTEQVCQNDFVSLRSQHATGGGDWLWRLAHTHQRLTGRATRMMDGGTKQAIAFMLRMKRLHGCQTHGVEPDFAMFSSIPIEN